MASATTDFTAEYPDLEFTDEPPAATIKPRLSTDEVKSRYPGLTFSDEPPKPEAPPKPDYTELSKKYAGLVFSDGPAPVPESVPGMEKLGGVPPEPPKPPTPTAAGVIGVEPFAPASDDVRRNPRTGLPMGPGSGPLAITDTATSLGGQIVRGTERVAEPLKAFVVGKPGDPGMPRQSTMTPEQGKELAKGGTEILSGAMQATTLLIPGSLLAAPLRTIVTIGAAMAADKTVSTGLKAAGVSPEWAEFGGAVAGFLAVGKGAHSLYEKVWKAAGSPTVEFGKIQTPKEFADMSDDELLAHANKVAKEQPPNAAWQREQIAKEVLKRQANKGMGSGSAKQTTPTQQNPTVAEDLSKWSDDDLVLAANDDKVTLDETNAINDELSRRADLRHSAAQHPPGPTVDTPPQPVAIEPGGMLKTTHGQVDITKFDGRTVTYDLTKPDGTVEKGIAVPVFLFRKFVMQPPETLQPPATQVEKPSTQVVAQEATATEPEPTASAPEAPASGPEAPSIPPVAPGEPPAAPEAPAAPTPPPAAVEPPAAPVAPPAEKPPQAPPAVEPEAEKNVVRGNNVTVAVPGEKTSYEAQYALREASDVHPSHNPINFERNPNYEHENDRDYKNNKEISSLVVERSGEMFDPAYTTTESTTAEHGAPVIDTRNNVLGGNSRDMTLIRVYALNPEGAAAYKASLRSNATKFGLTPEDVDRFRNPILVRELKTQPDTAGIKRAITDFNKRGAADLAPGERAVSDGRGMSDVSVRRIAAKLQDVGEDSTLAQAMEGSNGAEVIDGLVKDGVISPQERGALVDDRGLLTPEAKDRIAKMLVGRMFETSAQYGVTPPALRNKLERVAPQVLRLEGRPEWSITPQIREAVGILAEMRQHGLSNVDDLIHQDVFGVENKVYSPEAVQIAKALTQGPLKAAKDFRQYANDEVLSREGAQSTFFTPPTRDEAFAAAFGEVPAALEGRQPGGKSLPGDQPLFPPETEEEVNAQQKQYDDKLLHDQLTAQFASGTAVKPSKLKPAETRNMFEPEGPEQEGLFPLESRSTPPSFSQAAHEIAVSVPGTFVRHRQGGWIGAVEKRTGNGIRVRRELGNDQPAPGPKPPLKWDTEPQPDEDGNPSWVANRPNGTSGYEIFQADDKYHLRMGGGRSEPFDSFNAAKAKAQHVEDTLPSPRVGVYAPSDLEIVGGGGSSQSQGVSARKGAADSNQLSLFDERSVSIGSLDSPAPPRAPGAYQVDPASIKRLREPAAPQVPASLAQVQAFWDGAQAYTRTLGGHEVLFVNRPAIDIVLRRMGAIGSGRTGEQTLGTIMAPGEWGNIVKEAEAAKANPRPGGFDDALIRLGDKIAQRMGNPGKANQKPMVVAQVGSHIPDHVIKRIIEEELDHAAHMALPGGLRGLPVEIVDTPAGQKAMAALNSPAGGNYAKLRKESPFYAHNLAAMTSEIGVRLMRPGRWQELDLTAQEAGDLAEAFIMGLAKHGKAAHGIVEQIYGSRPKTNPAVAPRPSGVEGQNAPASQRGPPGEAQAAPKAGQDVSGVATPGETPAIGPPADFHEPSSYPATNPPVGSKGIQTPDFYARGPQPIVKPPVPSKGQNESQIVLQSRKTMGDFLKSEEGSSALARVSGSAASQHLEASGESAALSRQIKHIGASKSTGGRISKAAFESGAKTNAVEALKTAENEPSDKGFGEKVRTLVTGERDVRVAETNQLRDGLRTLVPNHIDQEAITLMRDFRNNPGEMQQFLGGTHPAFNGTPGQNATARSKIQQLRPVIERALSPSKEMVQADGFLTQYFAEHLKEGQKIGFLKSSLTPDEYITHLFEILPDPDEPKTLVNRFAQLFRGRFGPKNLSHARKRSFPTVLHAVAGGGGRVGIRTLNAFDALGVYGDRYATVAAYHLFIEAVKESGVGKYGSYPDQKSVNGNPPRIPPHWVALAPNSRLFTSDHAFITDAGDAKTAHQFMFVPPSLEEAMQPILDPDYTNRIPGFKSSRMYQTYIKSVSLGMSVFHLRAMNMAALGNAGITGLAETYMSDMKSEEFLDAERTWVRAGMKTPVLDKTVEVYMAMRPSSLPTTLEKIQSLPGIKQMNETAASISHLTFGIVQRKMKVVDASIQFAAWIAKNPTASPAEEFEAQRSIAKEVNAIYGGLNWEVMGINRTTLSLLKFVQLAPDWTFSNFANAKYSFESGPGGNAARISWVRSVLFGIALTEGLGLMLTGKLHSGSDPTQVYLGKDKEGNEMYMNMFFTGAQGDMATLVKNVSKYGVFVGLAKSIMAKTGILVKAGVHLGTNQDAVGRPVIPKTSKTDLLGRPTEKHKPGILETTELGAEQLARDAMPVPFSVSTLARMLADPKHHYTALQYVAATLAGRQPQELAK